MGDYRSCLGAAFVYGFSKAYEGEIPEFSGQLIYPVHPGTAKQVMEPATLWFERRVRRVQTCDKRQTVEVPTRSAGASKGGDYTSFRFQNTYE